jgi:anaerobic dimethyl sulfoxide reductase subunit B (iron-sulfur subunit)
VNGSCFTIDLARCTGCQACSIACKDRAGLPDDVDWLRVEAHESGVYPKPELTYKVVHCFHCAEPPCTGVCPTNGLSRGDDGWVKIDETSCTACEACLDACPFSAIAQRPGGGATKCDGCADEVRSGWEPICVRACPMRALEYGPMPAEPPRQRVKAPDFEDHGIAPAVQYWRWSTDQK